MMAQPPRPRPARRLPEPGRRELLRQALACCALGLSGCASRPTDPTPDTAPEAAAGRVAPFSGARLGSQVPAGWRPYVLRQDKPLTRYTVVSDGPRQVLHARAAGAATGLQCPVRIDPATGARLRFSWRVQQVPEQATVEAPECDDSPARLVLAFDGDPARLSLRERLFFDQVELFTGHRLPYATLMYVWDGALEPETVVHNHRTSRIRYLTVEQGSARAGRWLHYERDVVADFQRAYGEAPGPITSVGVLTDSDALQHEVQAWYGDIELSVPSRG